jgi:hypothetical protein
MAYSKLRIEYLKELGYKVIQFTNDDVKFNTEDVSDEISRMVERQEINSPHPHPLPKGEGEGMEHEHHAQNQWH